MSSRIGKPSSTRAPASWLTDTGAGKLERLAIPHAVNHVLFYAAAIAIGSVATGLALGVLKKPVI